MAVATIHLAQEPGRGRLPPGTPVCDHPILQSPWNYDGAAGTLPARDAQGAADLRLRRDRLPVRHQDRRRSRPGTTRAPLLRPITQVNNAVVDFEPGVHQIENSMYNGHNTVYIGGYGRPPARPSSTA